MLFSDKQCPQRIAIRIHSSGELAIEKKMTALLLQHRSRFTENWWRLTKTIRHGA